MQIPGAFFFTPELSPAEGWQFIIAYTICLICAWIQEVFSHIDAGIIFRPIPLDETKHNLSNN
jgi:hypothetical protein